MRELGDDAARKRVSQCCRGRPVPVPAVVLVSLADFSDGVLERLAHLVVGELLHASRRERRRLRGYEVVRQIRAGSLQRADDDDRAVDAGGRRGSPGGPCVAEQIHAAQLS